MIHQLFHNSSLFLTLTHTVLALKRLIERAFVLSELPLLIEAIFSNEDESDTVSSLRGDDAQTFIDVIDEVLLTLFPHHET